LTKAPSDHLWVAGSSLTGGGIVFLVWAFSESLSLQIANVASDRDSNNNVSPNQWIMVKIITVANNPKFLSLLKQSI